MRSDTKVYDLATGLAVRYGARGSDVDDAAQEGVIAYWLDSVKFADNQAYNTHAMTLRLRKHIYRGDVFGRARADRVPSSETYHFDRPEEETGQDQWGVLPDKATPVDEQVTTQILVRDAIAKLPATQKEAVVRYHLYGQDRREAAEAMGMKPQTFSNMVYRGLENLRKLLR